MTTESILWTTVGFWVLAVLWRQWRFGVGKILSQDDRNLYASRWNLSGRPDQIVQLRNGAIIPVEMKSRRATRIHDGVRLQLGAYLLLVEAEFGRRPPFGIVVMGDNRRRWIRNTVWLRRKTRRAIKAAHRIRSQLDQPVRGVAQRRSCRPCGYLDICQQGQRAVRRRLW